MNSEDIINALNEDSIPESEEEEEEVPAVGGMLDMSHEEEGSSELPKRSLYMDDDIDLVPIGE